MNLMETLKMEIEEVNYKQVRKEIKIRHSQGIDAITLILRNEQIGKII